MVLTRLVERIRSKNLENWLPAYARQRAERALGPRYEGTRHLLFAICDHYEPEWGAPAEAQATERVATWEREYPAVSEGFRDVNGRGPQHSFFFPGEMYRPAYLDALTRMVGHGFGEVELHLHHEDDTEETLRADLLRFVDLFAQHGHLTRLDGKPRYAFIHGNWCLANARADGRYCGVDSEVSLLWETGCYADFTFPAAPNESQPGIINQIYWPRGDLSSRRSYERGERATVGKTRDDRLLFIQGPLALTRRPSGYQFRIENADLQGSDPPTLHRLRNWVAQDITVAGRPEWVFVKVHTHGCPEENMPGLIGPEAHQFHQDLQAHYNDGHKWQLHYVSAREMYNVAMAAMEGHAGDPSGYFDHRLPPPPAAG